MMPYHRMLLALVVAPASLAGCESRAPDKAAGEALPVAYFMGPQPGPDRVLPQVTNPYAGSRAAMANGRRLFQWYNCVGCHGTHGGGGMAPSLRDAAWTFGAEDASVFASIMEGRPHGMPAWGTKIPSDQIWQIVTYIKSMRTPDEPDPPR